MQYLGQRYSDKILKAKYYPQDNLRMSIPSEFLIAQFINMKEIVEDCCSIEMKSGINIVLFISIISIFILDYTT